MLECLEQGELTSTIETEPMQAELLSQEIALAFRDSKRPLSCTQESIHGYEAERLNYLLSKTWMEIAGDLTFLTMHSFEEFFYISKECFYYYLPGYLIGVVRHKHVFLATVASSIVQILNPDEGDYECEKLASFLNATLTPNQKKTVAHWLKLEVERESLRLPRVDESHEAMPTTDRKNAFARWREWI